MRIKELYSAFMKFFRSSERISVSSQKSGVWGGFELAEPAQNTPFAPLY
jgi:hypothetical protein